MAGFTYDLNSDIRIYSVDNGWIVYMRHEDDEGDDWEVFQNWNDVVHAMSIYYKNFIVMGGMHEGNVK